MRGTVKVSGAAVLDTVKTAPDGSRTAYVTPTSPSGAGATYQVTVGAPPASVLARVTAGAANPPPPIAEPAARAMALGALDALAQSSNANLRSQAQLIQGLASVVFGSTDPDAAAS